MHLHPYLFIQSYIDWHDQSFPKSEIIYCQNLSNHTMKEISFVIFTTLSIFASCKSVLPKTYRLCDRPSFTVPQKQHVIRQNRRINVSSFSETEFSSSFAVSRIRGGSSSETEDESTSDDDEVEVEDSVEEESSEEEEEEDLSEDDYDYEEDEVSASEEEEAVQVYDEPLEPNPMNNALTVVGAMLILRRLDLNSAVVVRNSRIFFILYTVSIILFSMYVKFKARQINDQTPIAIENTLAKVVKSQINSAMAGSSSSETVKGLADKFLTSVSNVMEYDIQQAGVLRNSVLTPMIILWVMHFKMGQVQPLLMQVVSGFNKLMYHPLVQVYIMGRNLERPFKKALSPMEQKLQDEASDATEDQGEKDTVEQLPTTEDEEDETSDDYDDDTSSDYDSSDDDSESD